MSAPSKYFYYFIARTALRHLAAPALMAAAE
jgi:hypothetical protein